MDITFNNYLDKNQDLFREENLKNFSGLFDKKYLDPFMSGYSFVFITRPQLFIAPTENPIETNSGMGDLYKIAYENMKSDPQFVPYLLNEAVNTNDKTIPWMLSYFKNTSSGSYAYPSNFLRIFTNGITNFDPTDVAIENNQSFSTKEGYSLPLPTSKVVSQASGTLNFTIRETANLDYTKILSLWVNYISNITDGTFQANPEMVKNGELDYTASIFYFVLEPDGKTLKYWSKYTGCWPTAIPYGALKYTKGENQATDIDASFSYTVKEDMNPKILEEFNKISLNIFNGDNPFRVDANLQSYSQFTENPIFNEDLIGTNENKGSVLKDSNRDPLIFYRKSADNEKGYGESFARFELSFGSSVYDVSYMKRFDNFVGEITGVDSSENVYYTDEY